MPEAVGGPTMEKTVAALITGLAALLFSLGYIYLNSYYAKLGVSMIEVDYTINDVLVHSIVSLYWGTRSTTVIASALGLVCAFLIWRNFEELASAAHPSNTGRDLAKLKRFFGLSASCILSATAIVGLVGESIEAGSRRAASDLGAATPLWIGADESYERVLKPLKSELAFLTYISATKGQVFAAIRYRDGSDYWIVRFDRSKVDHMRMYRNE
jgi:hypothetical protein